MGGNHVVFVHGMFMTARCWDGWVRRFEEHGYTCSAPNWPGRNGRPADLRASPDPALRDLTLRDVVEVFRSHIATLDRKPVLVGHSMGGLVVQLLLQEGVATAGVALDSAPPRGVNSAKWSFLRCNLPVFLPTKRPMVPTPRSFAYAFMHTASREEVRAVFEEHVVPESRRVGRGPLGRHARLDFSRRRPPLLMIAGELDHIIPASLNRRNAKRYNSDSRTDLFVFDGRTHYILGQPGWEEVADRVITWLSEH